MRKNIPIMRPLMRAVLLAMGSCTAYAAGIPVYSIIPLTPTQVDVPVPNGTVTVQYVITNNSKENRWLTLENVEGIRVIGQGSPQACGNPFFLTAQGSCTMNLQIDGNLIEPSSLGKSPKICTAGLDERTPTNQCYWPSPGNLLQISTIPAPTRQLVTVGSSLVNTLQYPFSNNSINAGFYWSPALQLILPVDGSNTQGYLTATACDETGLKCVAVGSNESVAQSTLPPGLGVGIFYYSTDGGTSWTNAPSPDISGVASSYSLYAVTCDTTGTLCTAVGFFTDNTVEQVAHPLAFYTTDGGTSWADSTLPALPAEYTTNSLNSVSCDSAGLVCTTVGAGNSPTQSVSYSLQSTDGGHTWGSAYNFFPNVTAPNGVSATSVFCDAATGLKCSTIGSVVAFSPIEEIVFASLYSISFTTTDGGTTWTGPVTLNTVPGSTNPALISVSCDSTVTNCVTVGMTQLPSAVEPAGLAYVPLYYRSANGGLTWSGPTTLSTPEGASSSTLASISCTAAGTLCTAVGTSEIDHNYVNTSYTTINGGVTWGGPVLIPQIAGTANGNNEPLIFVGPNGIAGNL